jgi:hypothetical protein
MKKGGLAHWDIIVDVELEFEGKKQEPETGRQKTEDKFISSKRIKHLPPIAAF